MTEFIKDLFEYNFLQYALAVGILASFACGIVGSYVVVRRITYIAGGIAHCTLAGLGAARYLQVTYDLPWLHPMHGALLSALGAALIIGMVGMGAREREDTVISAIWAVGMATGILFISQTPGYSEDLMSYLFGNILMVAKSDLWLIAGMDALIITLTYLFYGQFMAVCFDEEFARLRGIRTGFYYLLLLCLTALTVVMLTTIVGVVMVIALITLPVATAGKITKTLWSTMLLSIALCMIFVTSGLAISYSPNLPAGATTVAIAGTGYLISCAISFWAHRGRRAG